MISNIIDKIVACSIHKNIMRKEDREIYEYGLCSLITKGLYNLSILLLGSLLGCLLEVLIFQFSYSSIRKVAGGHHSKSKWVCFLISCCVVLIAVVPVKLFDEQKLYRFAKILLLVSIAVISLLAPCDNENKVINKEERKVYKKKSLLVMVRLEVVSLMLLEMGAVEVGYVLAASLGIESLGLLFKIKRLCEKNRAKF